MNYRQCLRYLEQIQNLGIKFGLDNVRTILTSLNSPHRTYPSVLVAGSNGKGSVCAMMTRILTRHGFKAGLYTSPHLCCYEERIRVGEILITPKAFSRIMTRLRSQVERLIAQGKLASPPTHFEHLTCAALMYFAEKKVDIAVLEVGMGGRFDATNVADPVLSVITTISEEHQKSLGESLEEIAFEKAGIIRTGIPVVCGAEASAAVRVIREQARLREAPLSLVLGPDSALIGERNPEGYTFRFRYRGEDFTFSPSLNGRFQGKNAATALVAALILSRRWRSLDKDKILVGIATTRWEGRLEIYGENPLVILDGAHNREGAEALRDYICENMLHPLILVFATMQDKKIEELSALLFPLAERIILTRFPYHRAAAPDEIARRSASFLDRSEIELDPARALSRARELAGLDGVIIITGSLFLVGAVKQHLPDPQARRP
jgi:dihydrofolate synthase/folylpolyglutamate synthase